MTSHRVEDFGSIDRTRPIRFSFDGKSVDAFEGDTISSALLANGIGIVGRSFKYHRPRGIWGAGVEEPNGIVDVAQPFVMCNCRATTQPAVNGMVVRSVNATPTAAIDRNAFIDRFARFIPSAFYYKTFMWPNWHHFEPSIRRMAGLGILDRDASLPPHSEQVNDICDLLVIGGGPAGLFSALVAARQGKNVIVCDDGLEFGGSLLHRAAIIDGIEGANWINLTLGELRERGARLLSCTTAFGLYDHGLVALNERQFNGKPDRLWRLDRKSVV